MLEVTRTQYAVGQGFFHASEINGVERLLAAVRTDVIVIPKTSPLERLLLFARAGAPRSPFVAGMAIDP